MDGGRSQDILDAWLSSVDTALAEASSPDLEGLIDELGPDGDIDPAALGFDPEQEAEFLDGALGNLYMFGALEENEAASVPLPVLAASMVVPDEMEDPSDAVLEEVTEVMLRLDGHFRLLTSTGLIDYEPVDEALIEEAEDGTDDGESGPAAELDPEEVSRYGLVRLTPSASSGSAPGCSTPVPTPRPPGTWPAGPPPICWRRSSGTPTPPPAARPTSGSAGASPPTPPVNCCRPPAVTTAVPPAADWSPSRPSASWERRPNPPSVTSWTTVNSAAWPGSGSPSAAPPTFPPRTRI